MQLQQLPCVILNVLKWLRWWSISFDFIKEFGEDIPGYFKETFMISQGREMRNCCSDNAALVTGFVRFSVLLDRLNCLALVRQVNFHYHNSNPKPNKLKRSMIELELANLFQLCLLIQLLCSSLHFSLRNASILCMCVYIYLYIYTYKLIYVWVHACVFQSYLYSMRIRQHLGQKYRSDLEKP